MTIELRLQPKWLASPAGLREVHSACRASVIVPARNEENGLRRTLDALRDQVSLHGVPIPHPDYEVLLLLNNCTDGSEEVAVRYAEANLGLRLTVLSCALPSEQAHVGTARKILMDIACERLEHLGGTVTRAILSTDADTVVAPDWVAQNLAAIDAGADAVGGQIRLLPEDLDALDPGTRLAYDRDARLQQLVARAESILDPDTADPWPRHLQHFGASLACTPEIYRRSGGLPPVKPLEDIAFVDALRKVDARLRHSPAVQIFTSARLNGRAEVGLSGQLRLWRDEAARGLPQMVDSAEWMCHRFRTLGELRQLHSAETRPSVEPFPSGWQERLLALWREHLPPARFLAELDCDALIEEMFENLADSPPRRAEITITIGRLEQELRRLQAFEHIDAVALESV